ncbi:MAG: hypothetical protein WDZ35_13200 [Crocinitomicaceae bacterium]
MRKDSCGSGDSDQNGEILENGAKLKGTGNIEGNSIEVETEDGRKGWVHKSGVEKTVK